jgi:RNA polymerase sigma-70 factor (ECF subfamily)
VSHARPFEQSGDDAELLARVGEGDVPAYRELVRRYGRKLHHYAIRLTHDPAEAEDIVQETFLRLWLRASEYTPRARVTTWLHRIAHNLAIDRLRARGRWQALEDDDVAPISAPQARLIDDRRRAENLDLALAELPERQRAALVLVYLQELSGKEAAEVLQVSEEALESLLARARRALKARLAVPSPAETDRTPPPNLDSTGPQRA